MYEKYRNQSTHKLKWYIKKHCMRLLRHSSLLRYNISSRWKSHIHSKLPYFMLYSSSKIMMNTVTNLIRRIHRLYSSFFLFCARKFKVFASMALRRMVAWRGKAVDHFRPFRSISYDKSGNFAIAIDLFTLCPSSWRLLLQNTGLRRVLTSGQSDDKDYVTYAQEIIRIV